MDSTSSPPPPPPLPLPEEPQPKKLKMSSTTSTSDDETTATNPNLSDRKPRYKRRKIAIFFAYCGVGYQGMQKNPGAKTIEADLEEALYQSGAVPEPDRGNPKRFDWARSARTDKGVSAVGQVVSGRFYIDPPGFIDRLNSNLPNQIRIFGFKRVTNSFNAKKFCDRRRYVYLIPVFAFDPNSHPDRESVLASLGSENELVKCLECSERGRKVVGVMGRRNSESKTVDVDGNNVVSPSEVETESGFASNFANSNSVSESKVSEVEVLVEARVSSVEEKADQILVECSNGDAKPAKESGFCYGEKEKERFNRILSHYVGTHNFHNFTTRTKAEDPSAIRYIISFDAKTVVTVEGIDFVKCEIVGQSFMLHQIRKMIGLAVAVMRNCAPESLIDIALQKDVNINVPTAPEVGLYLDECFFTSYNQKWKDTHEEVSMKDYAEEAEDFKMKQIYSHIASTEQKEGAVAVWLHSLNHRNYTDLNFVEANGVSINGEAESAQVDSIA
ncbi:Pseudouridine synthase I [Macleaya cordata]|uniref:Pseudouridine synthase I n=1 Tax=Macleaya cordata TaxID=56857 RepID=A0A200QZZ6_MACCD|nr:Pseudouridine synthase I [Macleaya cordata]